MPNPHDQARSHKISKNSILYHHQYIYLSNFKFDFEKKNTRSKCGKICGTECGKICGKIKFTIVIKKISVAAPLRGLQSTYWESFRAASRCTANA